MSNIMGFEGKNPELGKRVWIDPSARLIGDITLGDDVSIWRALLSVLM